jgi:membrane associated rhomboid family serine protease
MHAFHSPWSLAPGFEINPCDPDENLLVELVRRDRYLKKAAGHAPTDEEHLASLTKERAFLAGLSGRRVLVRTILAVNVLVWLALELTGGSMSAAQLLRAGAKSNGLILAGQYWRFVTPIFLHVGLAHLVINSAGLLFLGDVLERIYGSMQLALVYFVAGVASVVASFYLGQEMMAGASGAIFGLAGALVVYGFRYRRRVPARFGAMFGGGLLPLIGLNIGFGLFVKGIDNWAHLGGLVAGTAVTLFLRPLADEVTPTTWLRVRRVAALAMLGVVVGAAALAAHNFVRYGSIYDTDIRWVAKKEIPGGLEIRLPASWAEVKRDNETAVFRATGYEAWLEARAVDVSKDTNRAVLAEFAGLQREGFPLPGPWPYSGMALLNELCARGRAETTLTGPKRAQRRQTFLLVGNTLVSLGVVTPEKTPVRFAPVLDRIFDSLPEPE